MSRKIEAWRKDYDFYIANMHKFTFFGDWLDAKQFKNDDNGKTADLAFKALDSQGKVIPCKETDLLKKVMTCKKSINFHIKTWAEGFIDFGEDVEYYMQEFINPPEWIRVALVNQIRKNGG